MIPYYELPKFKHLYLEDSFVLDISSTKEQIVFEIEFVLTEAHEQYRKPLEGEHHCYEKGFLKFEACRNVIWHKVGNLHFRDKSNEIDMGNIDSFSFEGENYFLQGDWGEVEITSRNVTVLLGVDSTGPTVL